jgi:hypothetical protein
MAASRVGGKNGAVSFISAHGCDFYSWNLRANHPIEDDTAYTDATSTASIGSSHVGSGVVDYFLTANGWAGKGAAGLAPGLAIISATGGAVTVTADSGCTEAGTFILSMAEISHAKRQAATQIRYEGANDGNITETWSVS